MGYDAGSGAVPPLALVIQQGSIGMDTIRFDIGLTAGERRDQDARITR